MKNIFYICTKPIDNWDFFTPIIENTGKSQSKISVLIIHEEQNLPNVHASHIWNLNQGKSNVLDASPIKGISYQKFLEQIFLHDLSMVI